MRSRNPFGSTVPYLLMLLLATACGEGMGPERPGQTEPTGETELTVQVQIASEFISTVVVEVTASDISTAHATNLTIVDSTASGTISVPTGSDRTFTVRAYNSGGIETHRGAETVNIVEGSNAAIVVRLMPLTGDQPIDVVIGTISVTVAPATGTLNVGNQLQLAAEVTDDLGNVLDVSVNWATLAPHLATVSNSGLVSGVAAGSAQIVATYAGTGGSASITVTAEQGLIVFDYYDGTNRDIYSIQPDGTGLTRLTTHVGSNPYTSNEDPSLSHDRTKIVFSREWNLWSMNVDGSSETQLTFVSANTLPNIEAQWSPDGTKIVFESQFACCTLPNREIHTISADGSTNVRLTNNTVWDGQPSWSPDGTQLLFVVGDGGSGTGPATEIYRMDVDGTNVTRLTDNSVSEYSPIYSPDGTEILFYTDRDGQWEVYAMAADGSQQDRLTTTSGGDSYYHDWSPDGQSVVFTSNRAGTWDLYIMNADGSGATKLTDLASTESMIPSWQ